MRFSDESSDGRHAEWPLVAAATPSTAKEKAAGYIIWLRFHNLDLTSR